MRIDNLYSPETQHPVASRKKT